MSTPPDHASAIAVLLERGYVANSRDLGGSAVIFVSRPEHIDTSVGFDGYRKSAHLCFDGERWCVMWKMQCVFFPSFEQAMSLLDDELCRSGLDMHLQEHLPDLVDELKALLEAADEPGLASQVQNLKMVERCGCGERSCGGFYTVPKPNGAWGPAYRNIVLEPAEGMLIVDIVDERICFVEILDRKDLTPRVHAALA